MKCYPFISGYLTVPAEVMLRSGSRLSGPLTLAARSLLVEHEGRRILIDPGLSPLIPPEQQEAYGISFPADLSGLPAVTGLSPETITDVILTHLHFDHTAGAISLENRRPVKRYPFARYHLPRVHTSYCREPDPSEADVLFWKWTKFMEISWLEDWDEPWMRFEFVNGHTPGMAIPIIPCQGFDLVYGTDLIPMHQFTRNTVSSGYDLDPGMALEEKNRFLRSVKRPAVIILYHDPGLEYVTWPEAAVGPEKIGKVLVI
ncbi:MAG: MBL fold metallo-hydrolase [Bacteroidota bacterium]